MVILKVVKNLREHFVLFARVLKKSDKNCFQRMIALGKSSTVKRPSR